jgi:hypothetical protein
MYSLNQFYLRNITKLAFSFILGCLQDFSLASFMLILIAILLDFSVFFFYKLLSLFLQLTLVTLVDTNLHCLAWFLVK